MIRFADETTKPIVRQMWQTCFEDTDEFMELYFTHMYSNNHTLIYVEEGNVVASLQMLPYEMTFYGKTIPFYYLGGLCTLAQYRNRGYMAQLIRESHRVMQERGIPIAILIPAENSLFEYYERFGYETVFEGSETPLPSFCEMFKSTSSLEEMYTIFDAIWRQRDFCVQKSFTDFIAIVEDIKEENCPPKYNLSGMACVVNAEFLLQLYAIANPSQKFTMKLANIIYGIENGKVNVVTSENVDMKVDSLLLCRLLFGYRTNEMAEEYSTRFAVHHPTMNLMLE